MSTLVIVIISVAAFIAIIVLVAWLYLRAWNARQEWLPVVDEKGEIIGKATRDYCHSGKRLLHPVVHLHITNSNGDILLQKRSMNKTLLPGKWDTAVGGHVIDGESVEDALVRESLEELGINRLRARFLTSYVWEGADEREFIYVFLCTDRDEITPNPAEVDEVRFWSREDIEKLTNTPQITPNFLREYTMYLRKGAASVKKTLL
ncbi:MAG: NUDIX domain-containing protein [Odoribacteraceae bacterium]|nr:NUDIX domain-containing protein [Odoribacteraceae bacterium]